MSHTNVEQILLNLKIIGMLRQHERFSTQNNVIIVEQNSFMQGLRRWLRGEKRSLNLEFLQEVFNRAFSFLDSKMPNIAIMNGQAKKATASHINLTNIVTNMPRYLVDNGDSTTITPGKINNVTTTLEFQRDTTADSLLFARVLKEINTAVRGIQNLQTTYESDSLIVARSQVMVDSIFERLQIYNTVVFGKNKSISTAD